MREFQRKNHPFKGKKRENHSKFMYLNNPMSIEKHRESHFKSCHTEKFISEARDRMIGEKNHFFGKTHSEETKKKLSKLYSLKVNQISIETLEIINTFNSIKEAIEKSKIYNISSCCRGKTATAGGFYWEYNDITLKKKYEEIIKNKRKNTRRIYKK